MSTVSLIRANSYDQQRLKTSLETLLAPLGGMEAFVKPGDRVLLKPNLLTAARPGKECITRPELVYAVAQRVQEAGGKPFLGDSPAFGTAKGVAAANGYLPMMAELNVPIVEFQGQRYETLSNTFNHLRLCKEAMEADVIINLPKVKSHMQLTLTLGVKNLFGCVPGKMKAWWHMEAGKDACRFGEMLVETARAINPDLTIVDGIIGHQGNGPSGGEPRSLNILAASADIFALDQSLVNILNVDPALVPTIVAAMKLGLSSNLEGIDFPHLRPEDLKILDWKLPDALMPIDFGMPRVLRSTFKHLYIRFIKEPIQMV
ncbi:MAG TPA: thylakoid-associated protein [Cyanobacteria bacterium UBA12227]|nr:thylakoid-associated protein [Cyanobacteria bacterium UBA12227]HAX86291.1 thylakoid-associated protein [Cyanobacteria bacterium UBA11370]HBY77459.1 thylakoid-associated protein [Cyanobacteria bacterium UBA11148]